VEAHAPEPAPFPGSALPYSLTACSVTAAPTVHRLEIYCIGLDRRLYQKSWLLELETWAPNPGWSRIDASPPQDVKTSPAAVATADSSNIFYGNSEVQSGLRQIKHAKSGAWEDIINPTQVAVQMELPPTVISRDANQMDLIYTGTQAGVKDIYYQWFDGTGWHGNPDFSPSTPFGLPLKGATYRKIAAASWSPTRLDLIVVGTNGQLYWKALTGQSWYPPIGWESIFGNFGSAPAAVSWGPDRIDVVGIYDDGTMNHAWFDGVNWSWQSEPIPGSYITFAPSAVSLSAGTLDIFTHGVDHAAHHISYDGRQGWKTESLGGQFLGALQAVAWAGRIDVFGVGMDYSVYHHKLGSGLAWEYLGGKVAGLLNPYS